TLQQLSGMSAGLFDTLVIFENYPVDVIQEQTGEALPVESVESIDLTTYPMTLTARLDKALALKFEYLDTVLSEPGASQLLAHLQQLLKLLSSPGDNTLRDIKRGMLSHQARKEIFIRSVGEQIHFPGARCFHHRFEQQVRRNGSAIAACHGPHSVDYAALNQRANQLAHWLIEQGVTQGQLVGIFAHRSIDVLCAMLAIMKAGGAFVCLDPVNPDERVTYMIEDSGIDHLIVDPACRARIGMTAQLKLFDITQSASVLSDMPVDNPQVSVQGSDVAYMIYTSGSTGNPKGAMVHHSGALNHIEAEFAKFDLIDEANSLKQADFLQCAASSCDVSVWQFLAPLMCGGKTVILDEITDVHTMVSLIRQYQIDLVEVAPVVLQLLVSYLERLPELQRQLPGLKYIMTTGEPTPVPLVNKWLNMYPRVPIMNCYGPTEASDDITYEITRAPLPAGTTRVSIGKPLPNLAILILDEELDLMPDGVAGELCVTGIGVGPGYWNNEAKTQASFIPNPYQHEPLMPMYSDRLYRTGDLGYYDENGNIELLGRKDEQIKIRGLRVELGEIEAALEAIEQVQQAVVVVKDNGIGEATLCAYWTGEPGVTMTRKEFRLRLGQTLPEHMIPVSYNQLDKMPTNAADKIDKFALPEPDFTAQQTYVAAQTETEVVVAGMVAALLQLEVEQVSLADSFFELGGHSILSVRLVSEIQQRFGVTVPLGFIFTLSDLRELAAEIDVLRPQQQDSAKFAQLTAESQTDTDELII
ncbi:non-ribosomal peptide synthetase, partial [Pseudoalteromonas luteoviolacea]